MVDGARAKHSSGRECKIVGFCEDTGHYEVLFEGSHLPVPLQAPLSELHLTVIGGGQQPLNQGQQQQQHQYPESSFGGTEFDRQSVYIQNPQQQPQSNTFGGSANANGQANADWDDGNSVM